MLHNYTAPGVPLENFLSPTGLALSIQIIAKNGERIEGITRTFSGFDPTHIHWLGEEISYMLSSAWFSAGNNEEQKELNQLMGSLFLIDTNESIQEKSTLLIDFMKKLIVKYGEEFYEKMLSFDSGKTEDDHGNNRMFQSSRLGECILLGIRVGVEGTIIERWKTKLKESDTIYIRNNIFPK